MRKLLAAIILVFGALNTSLAQAPPPSGSPPSSFVGAPIDQGVWILALLVVLFGAYTLMAQSRKLNAVEKKNPKKLA